MTKTLEQLIGEMEKQKPYQPMTEEAIHTQAKNRYQSVYDQKRLDARQAYETEDAALARELSGLQKTYDGQRKAAAAQTRDTYSQADRHALSRGMQRSSYNEANLTGIRLAGDAAQRGIDEEQAQQEKNIGEKRTQLSRQLAQTVSDLNAGQKNDELAYADELTRQERQRAQDSQTSFRQLALQLYEYQHQLEQEAEEQARWQAEFRARYGDPSAGASSAGRRTAAASAAAAVSPAASGTGVRRNQRDLPM